MRWHRLPNPSANSTAEPQIRYDQTSGAIINICENIIVGSQLFPDRDAIVFDDQRLTYQDLDRLSAKAASVLGELGVERGDRVALVIPNVPAFVVWYYAILRVGAIAVSISTRLSSEEVAFILTDCGSRVVIGPQQFIESMGGHSPDCVDQILSVSEDAMFVGDLSLEQCESFGSIAEMERDEPATILYTSGTTGFPKGATLSHGNVVATMLAFNHLCGMRTTDRLLLSVPLFHCYGQNALLNSGLNVGATIILQRRFDLGESKRLISNHRVTMLFGVPMMFQLLLDSCSSDALKSIRYCFSAAAKLPEQLGQAWQQAFGMPIYEGYGLTETAPFASYNHRLQFKPGSIGTPVDLVEMKIVDPESGRRCPPGTVGEIAIRGPNVMLGYWNRPEETAAAIRDGWFYSGDLGHTDEQGYFYIVDRLKDMIVIGALKVFPAEVERVLLDHVAVTEAAVVGRANPLTGETVVAFLVLTAGTEVSVEELRNYCKSHLGSYKVPRQFVLLDQLPRNPAGKVLKTELRKLPLPESEPDGVAAGDSDESIAATRPSALAETGPLVEKLNSTHAASRQRLLCSFLREELRELTGREESIDLDAPIISDEIDSLMIVEFRDRLQVQLGACIQLPATIIFDHPKIADLAAYVLASLEFEFAENQPTATTQPQSPSSARQASQRGPAIAEMSEQQALEALLREVND